MKRKRRLREQVQGLGQVYKKDEWLADVWYFLRIIEEVVGSGSSPGPMGAEGEIDVRKGERDLVLNGNGPYSLHLQDGRRIEIVVYPHDRARGIYAVERVGGG